MANRNVQGRMQQKADTSANWALATTFVPLKGEIIVYTDINKIKIGDGVNVVNDLPFQSDADKVNKDLLNLYDFSGTWTAGALPETGTWTGIAYGNDIFVTVDRGTKNAAWSRDGINWNTSTLPVSNNWAHVCFGNGIFILVGESNNNICITRDGINWTYTENGVQLFALGYGNGLFIGFPWGSSNFYLSKDGLTWETIAAPKEGDWQAIRYCDNIWIAACSGTDGAYSYDGRNWTLVTMPADEDWQTFGYVNGAYLCFAHRNKNYAYSTDAVNWQLKTHTAFDQGSKFFFTADGSGRVVVLTGYTSSRAAYYSTDGINWTYAPFTVSKVWWHMAYGAGKFLAVGKGSAVTNYMLAPQASGVFDTKFDKKFASAVALSGDYNDLRNQPDISGKANKTTSVTSTMTAANWSSNTYSFESTYPVATYNIEIELAPTATVTQAKAYGKAMITGSSNSNVVTAIGTVPTVDIPIIIAVEVK